MQESFDSLSDWHSSDEEALIQEIDLLQTHPGGPRGYRLRRIILINYWLYTYQLTFEIPHGRILLTGDNATGKSTVLTAAFPLALEGSLRPTRLDTFGEQYKNIEYYVLGSPNTSPRFEYEARTSYIALEFEWCDDDHPPIEATIRQRWQSGDRKTTRFLTIGLGLYGKSDRKTRIVSSYYLITDGSRIGYNNFSLISDKRPLTQSALKLLLKDRGIWCEKQTEYEILVSRYLFGYRDINQYNDLIDLLLVLRQPNLSSTINLTDVQKYLKLSLPTIPMDATRRVIETINEIEEMKRGLARLKEEKDAVMIIHKARQGFVLSKARSAAYDNEKASRDLKSANNTLTRLQGTIARTEREWSEAKKYADSLTEELQRITGTIQKMGVSSTTYKSQQLADARIQLETAQTQEAQQLGIIASIDRQIATQEETWNNQKKLFDALRNDCVTPLHKLSEKALYNAIWETVEVLFKTYRDQLKQATLETPSLEETIKSVQAGLASFDASNQLTWLRTLNTLHGQREKIEDALKNAEIAEKSRFDELDGLIREFQAKATNFDTALEGVELILIALTNTYTSFLPGWIPLATSQTNEQAEVVYDEKHVDTLVKQYNLLYEQSEKTIVTFEHGLQVAKEYQQDHLNTLQIRHTQENQMLAQLRLHYKQKGNEPEYHPPTTPHRVQARHKLAEYGVQAYPFYMLIDFTPNIARESEKAGQLEYLLEDAGLLHNLVVLPRDREYAIKLLQEEGLSDCVLLTTTEEIQTKNNKDEPSNSLFYGLCFDETSEQIPSSSCEEWRETVTSILQAVTTVLRITVSFPASEHKNEVSPSAVWHYGLLSGHTGKGQASCIGKETRLHVRRQELRELDEQIKQLQNNIIQIEIQIEPYKEHIQTIQSDIEKVHDVLVSSRVTSIIAQLSPIANNLKKIWGVYRTARDRTLSKRQERLQVIQLLEQESKDVTELAYNYKRVISALEATNEIITALPLLLVAIEKFFSCYTAYHQAEQEIALEEKKKKDANAILSKLQLVTIQTQAGVRELERVSEGEEDSVQRLKDLQKQERDLPDMIIGAKTEESSKEFNLSQQRVTLSTKQTEIEKCKETIRAQQEILVQVIMIYPVPQFTPILSLLEHNECEKAVHLLLADLPQEESFEQWNVRLESEAASSSNNLLNTYHEQKTKLFNYGPLLDIENRSVIFQREQSGSPIDLLSKLEDEMQTREVLLEEEESKLFENFLLQDMAEIIRSHIFRAQDWVETLNKTLASMPIVGDKYELEWKANTPSTVTKLGGHLAQRQNLLSKPLQALTLADRELVRTAFHEELEAMQHQQKSEGMHFEEVLRTIFDYRDWFEFQIYVTPKGGKRIPLDNKVRGGRSGAERLFDLYVPLFAALSSLYDSAAPGAPRLLALDEAFDKASDNNMKKVIELLAKQNFQWIMTGPQINISGSHVPVSIRYSMLHEKGSLIATAEASRTWQSNMLNTDEGLTDDA